MSAKTMTLMCVLILQALFCRGIASAQGQSGVTDKIQGDEYARWVLGGAYSGRVGSGFVENGPPGVQFCRSYDPKSDQSPLPADTKLKACSVLVYSTAGTDKIIADLHTEVLTKLDAVPDQVKASIKEEVERDILNELRKEIAAGRLHSQNTDSESGMPLAYSVKSGRATQSVLAEFSPAGVGVTFLMGLVVGAAVFRTKFR